MSNNSKIDILAILAHPDDEAYLLAGTIQKFREEGKTVGIVCATRGEKGEDRSHRQLTMQQMAEIRSTELQKACKICNCRLVNLFSYPDGGLDKIDSKAMIDEFERLINTHQPQIILTFGKEGITGHEDHIAVGKAALAASKQATLKPSEIWLLSLPSSDAESFQNIYEKNKIHHSHFKKNRLLGVADEKLTRIDIRKYRDTKIAALEAHDSQYVPENTWPGFFDEECFEVIKLS